MKRREPKTLAQKLRAAHAFLFEIDEQIEKVEELERLPSFNPNEWTAVSYNIKLARKMLGKAQVHAGRLARERLARLAKIGQK